MLTESQKTTVENLAAEEAAEKQLISLYLTLLQAGAERCLPRAKRADFRAGLDLVYQESIRHQKIISKLLIKYRPATI